MRSLPERTVDAWVVSATTAKFPTALIWAPTPRKVADEAWDLGIDLGTGKIFILEDKATEAAQKGHTILIDLAQLHRYCDEVEAEYHFPVYYVLPKPPWQGEPTGSPVIPDQAAHRTNPNFATWAYVIRCTHLRQALGAPPGQQTKTIRTDDLPFQQNCMKLDDFLTDVHACTIGAVVTPPTPPQTLPPGAATPAQSSQGSTTSTPSSRPQRNAVSSDRLEAALGGGRPIAVFVPSVSLPQFPSDAEAKD